MLRNNSKIPSLIAAVTSIDSQSKIRARNLRRAVCEVLEGRCMLSAAVVSINRTTPPGPTASATTVTYTVQFNQPVTGVDATDFRLDFTDSVAANPTVVVKRVSGSVYSVSVSGIHGSGTLGLNLMDNGSIHDLSGHSLEKALSFAAPHTFAAGYNVNSLISADLNADGKLDLVTAITDSNAIGVLLGDGTGAFQMLRTFAVGSSPQCVTSADLNGDHKVDLIAANMGSNTVSVLLGNGNGTFQPQKTFAVGQAPLSVTSADVNADGIPDLIVANQGSNTVGVLLGNGNGTFKAQKTFTVDYAPDSVIAVDVNKDNKPDLIVDNSSYTLSILLGNGDGTFQPQTTLTGRAVCSSLISTDVNGDGNPDLIAGKEYGIDIFLGNGNGTFQTNFLSSNSNPMTVTSADMNADGKPDLVTATADYSNSNISVLLGNGDGTFSPPVNIAVPSNPGPVIVADLNADGLPDVITTNSSSKAVTVLLRDHFSGELYTIDQSTKLAFMQAPSIATVGHALRPVVTVAVEDASNHVVTTNSSEVTLKLNGGTFADGSNTATAYAVGGIATFSNLWINEVGHYTLTATDGSLTPATSGTFNVIVSTAGQADPSFGTGGVAAGALFDGGAASATVIQPNGRIIAAGSASGGFALARFLANGRQLDPTFGVNGRVVTSFADPMQWIAAIALQADGKIVVAGSSGDTFPRAGAPYLHIVVARYLANGQLDTTFGSHGIVTISYGGVDSASALAIQSNGRILVAGTTTDTSGHAKFALTRITAAGLLDSQFGIGGTRLTDFALGGGSAQAIALQSNGAIVVGGRSESTDSDGMPIDIFTLARFTSAGKLDSTFGTGGIVRSTGIGGVIYSLAVAPDGKIIAGGESNAIDYGGEWPATEALVVRCTAAGKIDTTFGTNGVARILVSDMNRAQAFFIRKSNGAIAIAGTGRWEARRSSGSSQFVAQFTAAGKLDKTFGTAGVTQTPMATPLSHVGGAALQSDGKLVTVGGAELQSGSDWTLARYTTAGKLDDSFGYHGTILRPEGITGLINAMARQSDGKIIAVGSELSPAPGEPTDAAIVRYNADGTLDTTFCVNGRHILRIGDDAAYTSIAIESNGTIVVGGYGQSGGVTVFAVVHYLANGMGDPAFGAGGVVLTNFGDSTSQKCNAVAVQADGRVIAIGSTSSQMAIARYLPSGALDPSFGASGKLLLSPNGLPAAANSGTLLSSGRILIAGSIGQSAGLVRLLNNGKYDASFGVGGITMTGNNAVANAMAIDSTGRIVIAGSSIDNATSLGLSMLARYSASGKLDSTFGKSGIVTARLEIEGDPGDGEPGEGVFRSIAIQSDGKILAGGRCDMMYANIAVVLRFNSNGTLNIPFGYNGVDGLSYNDFRVPTSASILALPDGKILAADSEVFRLLGK